MDIQAINTVFVGALHAVGLVTYHSDEIVRAAHVRGSKDGAVPVRHEEVVAVGKAV